MNNPNQSMFKKIKHDGALTVATGRSRKETNWKNREMLWSEVVDRLSRTNRTGETFAEYKKLSKSEQGQVKDAGGFVGGTLKGGRRKSDAVTWRQLITLDADFVKGDLWASVEIMLGCACVMYSTHSHSPENPRLRLVFPMVRPITPDEYPAVARRLAADLGIDFFDDTTYEPHRLMYWPSTSADGEYIFKFSDEPWLDPDAVLARYPDWKDSSYWPESSRAHQARKKLADKQGDPLTKPGMVGVFCRTYTITEVIETFLGEVYGPVGEGRYTYLPGSTAGGLVVYDGDTFAYSHHGTDPIGGKLVNAFDLIRLHKFGDQDEDVPDGTVVTKLPSYDAMLEFVSKDEKSNVTFGLEARQRAEDDFSEEINSENWASKFETTKKGEVIASLANLTLILRYDPKLRGIAYDELKGVITIIDQVPWRSSEEFSGSDWSDEDDSCLRTYVEKAWKIYSPPKLSDALNVVGRERSFHPIREYLVNGPCWDGVPRLDALLIHHLGAEDCVYSREVMRKTAIAAVARIMEPGCKFDETLVLVGPQGVGKSTLFAKLGGKWFSDSLSLTDTKDKTAAEKLQGYWIVEVGELAGLKKAEMESIKGFLSRREDIYRPAYGRRTVSRPRQCIIVASTNAETGFLRDATGNRRYWPVVVSGTRSGDETWNLDAEAVRQIWAEAYAAYVSGESWRLSPEVQKEAAERQRAAMETDSRIGLIHDYLEKPLPENWASMDLSARRSYYHGTDFGEQEEGTIIRDRVCAMEIWVELYRKDPADLGRFESNEIYGLINQIGGWVLYRGNNRNQLKFKIYGTQKAFIREEKLVTKQ